jgi:large subunit ribosomal protein L13
MSKGVTTVKKYTYSAKPTDIVPKWYVVDAEGAVLGRLASQIAQYIRGKHNPLYTPSADTGDHIIVINAEKIVLTGKKLEEKTYYRHSGYVGGIKSITAKKLLEKHPEDLISFAVRGMLPKNRLGRKLGKKLRVYRGKHHPHEAQQPEILKIH